MIGVDIHLVPSLMVGGVAAAVGVGVVAVEVVAADLVAADLVAVLPVAGVVATVVV